MKESRDLRVWLAYFAIAAALFLFRDILTPRIQAFFADPEVVSFLLYLETGKVIQVSGDWLPPETTASVTEPSETEAVTEPPRGPAAISHGNTVNIRDSTGLRYDAQALLHTPLFWDLADGTPRVLVFHTHATESYTPTKENAYEASSYYRTLETEDNMVRVGQHLVQELQNMGIEAVHDTTFHDYPAYNGSYAAARRTLNKRLEQLPGLCLLLDIHRDAIENASGKQLATGISVNGRRIAQIMLVVGTDAGGLHHPGWEENLSLALKLQHQLESICPGICRYISLRTERFNQDLSPGAMLVEIGSAGNTLEEALAAVEILAKAISGLEKGAVTADSTS